MSLPVILVLMVVFTALPPSPAEIVTEYYVRPSDVSISVTCNGDPCLTWSEYISDSDHYFQSNTSFLFMPGTHYTNQSLSIEGISNVLFLGMDGESEILASIPCKCEPGRQCTCIVIRINGATNVTFKQLKFNFQLQRTIPGVVRMHGFSFAFDSHLQLEHCTLNVTISIRNPNRGSAINMYQCTDVQLLSMQLSYENDGISLANSNQSRIANCTVYSGKGAISMSNVNNTSILNVTTMGMVGFDLNTATNVKITNVKVINASTDAMQLHRMENVTVTNAVVKGGIAVEESLNVAITSCLLENVTEYGISIMNANSSLIDSVKVSNSKGYGITYLDATDSLLSHVTIMNTKQSAVNLDHTYNIELNNVSVWYSESYGIFCTNSINVRILDARSVYCSDAAIRTFNSSQCNITSIHVLYSTLNAISLQNTIDVLVRDAKVQADGLYKQNVSSFQSGLHLLGVVNTTIINVSITNANRGIVVEFSRNVMMYNATTSSWGFISINLRRSRHILMEHIKLTSSGGYTQRQLFFSTTSDILVKDCVFVNFSTPMTTTDVTRQPAVIEMYKSSRVVFENSTFKGNSMSCMKLIDTDIEVNHTLQFIGNSAYRGAAMLFLRNSSVGVPSNSSILFLNNQATATGGAIHLVSNDYYLSTSVGLIARSHCFLRGNRNTSSGKFIFSNNTAGQGGDVLYGGSLGRACTGYNSVSEYSRDIQCNSCLRKLLNISVVFPKTLSFITSDPSRVCFCENGIPNCCMLFQQTQRVIHSGQTVTITAAVVGQNFGTVSGSVFAHFINNNTVVESNEQSQGYRQQSCQRFTYTILSHVKSVDNTVLVLTAINKRETEILSFQTIQTQINRYQDYLNGDIFPPRLLDFPIYINITLLPCPPGFSSTDSSPKCGCNQQLQKLPNVICDIQSSTISRQGLVWVGYVMDSHSTVTQIATSSQCPLNYCKVDIANVSMTDPDTQCTLDHSGILCGGCQAGLSLALGSNQCLKCSNVYLLLLVPLALAGIVLVFFIKVLNITISQGYINGFIFYANFIKTNEYLLAPQAHVSPLTLFISWLNLDLGIETCLSKDMTGITKVWLQLVFPFYVWGIVGLMILLARYSSRLARLFGNNSVPVLATLFLMSYAKLLRMIVTALSHTTIEYRDEQKSVWSTDGNLVYMQYPHLLLFLAAVTILVFLWLPYTLLTLSAQWLVKYDIPLVNSFLNRIKPMLDAHYGPLKDKHRYWFGVLLVTRVVILLISTLLSSRNFSIITFSIITVSFLLTAWSSTGLYRQFLVSVHETSLFINLGLLAAAQLYTSNTNGNQTTAAYFLIGVAFAQFTTLVMYRVYCIVQPFIERYVDKCHNPQKYYSSAANDDGNWRYNGSIELSTASDQSLVSDTNCSGDVCSPSAYTEFTDNYD